MMLSLHGKGVSSGISIGKAFVLQRDRPEVPEYVLPRHLIEDEVDRFLLAVEQSRAQLQRIRNHIPSTAPTETASFIDTHLLILQDTMISEEPVKNIRERQWNAELALDTQSKRLVDVFEKMDDPYLRNRKTDVVQVVDRLLRNLMTPGDDEHERLSTDLSGYIVVATDLTPADAVLLKHRNISAFVTTLGGPISHTAILARSLDIPAIVGVHGATQYVRTGEELIVDGKRGVLLVAAEQDILAEFRRRKDNIDRFRHHLEVLKTSESVSADGQRISLMANIELPDDIKAVLQVGADGIGLYRTEFLFMNRKEPPGEEEQYEAYSRVIRALAGKPVTIRTLDLGGDKQVNGAGSNQAVNPALGLRAVRLCLNDTALFRPQLRAIVRASAHGPVRLMIPMLSNVGEVFRVLDLIREVKADLSGNGVRFAQRLPVGGMIEVPAAAIAADLFAPHLDFLSIGTNDLIQYTLAIDRIDDTVNYLYDPLHPSVIRLIKTTIDAGRVAGIPVAMCGEMAGDARYTRLLLGLGLTEFSMHPAALLEIKQIVLSSNIHELAGFAANVLQTGRMEALHALVDELNERASPENTRLS
ncbi:MAG: phosphoenolpyruvate--protein phosphotransferase [Acidiferrobacteraceae bacterium]